MKKVLLLGGTSFVGRTITQLLVDQNIYDISLFNRGISNPHLFPELERIKGSRDLQNDLKPIFNQEWDYIIDVSCYFPHQLRYILNGDLKGLSNYIFISTCSVYDNERHKEMLRNEEALILRCLPEQEIDESPSSYGNRKAECERVLINSGIPYTILRPPLIYGPYDSTDRLYYWIHAMKKENQILLPEDGKRVLSIAYSKDIAQIVNKTILTDTRNQIFNSISNLTISINEIIHICQEAFERTPELLSCSAEFLTKLDVAQWSGIPLWLNTDSFTYSNEKVIKFLDFKPTPLRTGLLQTIQYFKELNYPEPRYGISKNKKQELLSKLAQY